MIPEYKLTYFNYRGKGEVPRLLFVLAQVPYEDVRIEFEDWQEKKESLNLPFGQLPLLTVEGQTFTQSHPIARYLALKFGYAGKTDLDRLRADMIVHCCEDMALCLAKAFWEPDNMRKAEIVKVCREIKLPEFMGYFEKMLIENKGGDGFFVGDSITWADLTFFHYVTFVSHADVQLRDLLESYPKLKALFLRVEAIPQIFKWLGERPVTKH